MKIIKILFSRAYMVAILCGCGATLLSGCGKGYLNVNNNPNAPTTGAAVLIFTNAEAQTAATINGGDFFNVDYFMSYKSLVYLLYNISRNNYTSNDFTGVWSDCYHNLQDYSTVESASKTNGAIFLVAAAKTMEALNFQMLVDAYNNVPYSQALQLSAGITNPAYDSGQVVYNGCIAKLDSAIAIFESDSLKIAGAYNPGSADILFKGDIPSWVRLANTLKLRMLLHEVNVSSQASTIQSEIAKIAADMYGCLGAGQTAFVNPGYATDQSGHLSPLWSGIGYNINGGVTNNEQRANTYFISKLAGLNDPRTPFFYCSTTDGKVEGNPTGQPNNANATYIGSGAGPAPSTPLPPPYGISGPALYGILQSPTQPAILVSSWESLFLQAEATHRGLLPGGDAAAKTYYEQAITDNFKYLNVYTDGTTTGSPGTFAATYYSQGIANAGWNASPDKLQAIITQKYISLCFTNNEEAWTDFRRTGFPADLAISNDPAVLYPRVQRFIYPQSEYNANADNVAKEGNVTLASPKIFWQQ
ncbi:MAG TPA: SusD/RagB family nutrient-binding outer membrane lipoprotein [Puia sp.]